MISIPKNKKLILFDGVCNLCNYSVQKIIKFDTSDTFVFTSLQSNLGQNILKELNIDSQQIDSIVLYDSDKYYIKSSAILKIVNDFGMLWKWTQIFWLLPKPIRDYLYRIVAKNRYKWFGKKQQCLVPSKEIKAKFIG